MSALAEFYSKEFQSQETIFPDWFAQYRQQAFNDYLSQGLPHRKTEQWQYSSVEPIKNCDYLSSANIALNKTESSCVDIIDGVLSVPEALPNGVKVLALSEAMVQFKASCELIFKKEAHSASGCFENINTALLSEGLFFYVEKNVQVIEPLNINIRNTQSKVSHHSQHVFLIEEGASLDVIETFSGEDNQNYFNNHVSQFILKQNASANMVKVIEEGDKSHHIAKTNIFQYRDSVAAHHSFALNGSMVRSDINVDLIESGAHAILNGLYLTTGTQNVSHYTKVNHLCPHATSDEFYKGILTDKSKGTFNGTVYVAKDAQKTVAGQQNKNLLLSNTAEVNTKPQLEIFADDVKCAHGATIGQLDEKALFYLQSRGIAKADAAYLLVNAFTNDLIERLDGESFSVLKIKLHQHIEQHLRNSYVSK